MKKFILLLFFTLSFQQDTYPYFSNPQKQFLFEGKRIYINESSEKMMYLSGGGSRFNYLSYLNPMLKDANLPNQPTYLNADIKTDYKYVYNFEILQGTTQLSELDFLETIGLRNKAIELFQSQYSNYLNGGEKIKIINSKFGDFQVEGASNNYSSLFGRDVAPGYSDRLKFRNKVSFF